MTSPMLVLFALAAVVLFALWLEANTRPFRKIGAAATAILLALTLSNLGVIPGESPVYDFLLGQAVIAGIVLILLNVSLSSIKDAGATMLAAFGIGAVGSALGAVIMAFVVARPIGRDAWRLSGQFAATYIGGGMNFAAVGQQLGTRSDLFTAGIAADVIVTAIWLVACLVIPEIFAGRRNSRRAAVVPHQGPVRTGEPRAVAAQPAAEPPAAEPSAGEPSVAEPSAAEPPATDPPATDPPATDPPAATAATGGSGMDVLLQSSGVPLKLADFAGLASLTLGIMWLSDVLASLVPAVPKLIWLTTVVLLLAQLPLVRKLSGNVVIGNFLLLLFLASNGAKSVISHIVQVGPAIFYFAAGTVAIHGLIIFGIGFALKMDGDLLAVASQANVGGSATAMALAGARRRTELILPGIAVGMLGNALGNYAGIAIAYLARALLG
jgi:uncharacterized membrane protein